MSENQIDILKKFNRYARDSTKARSGVTRYEYLLKLRNFALWTKKEFNDMNKEDIDNYSDFLHEREFKDKGGVLMKIRKFFQWYYYDKGETKIDELPKLVEHIKTIRRDRKRINSSEVLTTEGIRLMIEKSDNDRDKALISVMFESACRAGEIRGVNISDLEFDEYGVTIVVTGKTGTRKIRLINSVPYLTKFLNNHLYKNKRDKPFFIL